MSVAQPSRAISQHDCGDVVLGTGSEIGRPLTGQTYQELDPHAFLVHELGEVTRFEIALALAERVDCFAATAHVYSPYPSRIAPATSAERLELLHPVHSSGLPPHVCQVSSETGLRTTRANKLKLAIYCGP
jgi:hypothetical protein